MNKFRAFRYDHTYMIQYGVIIFASSLIFYSPTLLNSLGFSSIQPSAHFKPALGHPIDAIYFSVVSITTLGFGDINPISPFMRLVVTVEVLLGIITIGQALNSIASKHEEKKRLPHRLAAYEDIRKLTCDLICYWKDIYLQSVPGKFPVSLQELLSSEKLKVMGESLDLDAPPNVSPPRTWWQWLPEQASAMSAMADKVLERHVEVLEPSAYKYVHSLLSNGMLSSARINIMGGIRQSDQSLGFPRPTNLGSYSSESEESLRPIIELDKWCAKEYESLLLLSNASINIPFAFPEVEQEITNPKSNMTQDKRLFQQAQLAEYRARERLSDKGKPNSQK